MRYFTWLSMQGWQCLIHKGTLKNFVLSSMNLISMFIILNWIFTITGSYKSDLSTSEISTFKDRGGGQYLPHYWSCRWRFYLQTLSRYWGVCLILDAEFEFNKFERVSNPPRTGYNWAPLKSWTLYKILSGSSHIWFAA